MLGLALAHALAHALAQALAHALAHALAQAQALSLGWELLLGSYGAWCPGLAWPAGLGLDLVLELGPLALGPVCLGAGSRLSPRTRRSAAGALAPGGATPRPGGA